MQKQKHTCDGNKNISFHALHVYSRTKHNIEQ